MTVSANSQFRAFCHIALLVLCLCLGFFSGCSIYEPFFLSMMRSALNLPVSIIGVFACVYFPLICTYFSFTSNKPIILYIICYIKAAAFGFSYLLVGSYFSTAGWMVQLLLLFSDNFTLLILLSLWIQHFLSHAVVVEGRFYIAVLLATAFIFIDTIAVVPFIKGLL